MGPPALLQQIVHQLLQGLPVVQPGEGVPGGLLLPAEDLRLPLLRVEKKAGDGAGAAILRAEEGNPVYMAAHSDGVKGPALTGLSRHRKDWEKELEEGAVKESFIHMDGQGVFKFAVRKVPEIIEEVLEESESSLEDIDYFVLHQANRRIIEAVAKRLKTDISKFPMNLEEYANTSAATVPILIDEMNRKGMFRKGQKIMMAGFGAGLTWAASLFEW